MKQFTLIHGQGFTDEEKSEFKQNIFNNLILNMKKILGQLDTFGISLSEGNEKTKDVILNAGDFQEIIKKFPTDLGMSIQKLWNEPQIKEVLERGNEYQLPTSAKYFFDELERIVNADYLPNLQDILRSRVKTTGIVETHFKIKGLQYKIYDVGGQRSERKKWIHCFENVHCVMFIAACSEYDQTLIEDDSVNRMQEALKLFDSMCNSKFFVFTSMILLLNKFDIFQEKLKVKPLENHFPEYSGGNDVEAAKEFVRYMFVSLNKTPTKQIYTHFTCATDTTQVTFVINSVTDMMVRKALTEMSII